MNARLRLVASIAACAAWIGFGAPCASTAMTNSSLTRTPPVRSDTIRRQVGLLPESARRQPTAVALLRTLDADDLLSKGEQAWNGIVSAQLSDAERALADAGAHLDRPSPPPPPESPSSDGDIIALAHALMDRYGWAPVAVPAPPSVDAWHDADRRRRARGLLALVNGPGLDPDRAHVILAATLDLLKNGALRAKNGEAMRALLRVSMGEVAAVHPAP